MKVEEEEEREVKLLNSNSTKVTKVTKPVAAPPSIPARRGNLGSYSVSLSKMVEKIYFQF
jgi:hypothetical protein